MSIALRSLFTVASLFAFAVPVSAQHVELQARADAEAPFASASAALFGPTAASVALELPSPSIFFAGTSTAMMVRQRTTHNVALMIVGGAGLIVGSIVGGDAGTVIMVGGGVVGLIGLYRYLQ